METLLSWAQGPRSVSVVEASGRAVDGQLAPDPSAFPHGCPAMVGGALPMGSPAGHPRPLLQSQPERGPGRGFTEEGCAGGGWVTGLWRGHQPRAAPRARGAGPPYPHPAPSASQPRQEPRAGAWSLSVPGAPQSGEGSAGSHRSGSLAVPPAGRSSGTGPPAPVQSRQVTWTSRPTAVSVEEVGPCRGF